MGMIQKALLTLLHRSGPASVTLFGSFPFLDTFAPIGPRVSNAFWIIPISRHFCTEVVSRNRRKRFLPFLDTFGSKIREKVSRNRRNNKKCLEMGENEIHFLPFLDTFGSKNKRKSV